MIQIVVPMAGLGSRFSNSEKAASKPMIEVLPGIRMIDLVIDHLALPEAHRFVLVALAEHDELYDFRSYFSRRSGSFEIVLTETLTKGPAMTAYLARDRVAADDELLVAYCDCFFTIDVMDFINDMRSRCADGGVMVYPSDNPFESYAQLNPEGEVLRTAEKQVISPFATAGLYYFRHGQDFFSAVEAMARSAPADGPELFVCPAYNEMIAEGKTVWSYPIVRAQRIEMGTPEDLVRSRNWLAEQADSKATFAVGTP